MEALYTGQHPNVTGFLGATFYPPRSSILIACEFMDLRSFKDVMVVMQASTKGVSCQTLYPGQFASKPEIGATFRKSGVSRCVREAVADWLAPAADALSYATGQKLLLGPYGLLLSAANKVLFGQILMSSSTKPSPLLEKYWGINPTTQAPDLNTYIFMLVGTFADPFLLQINADGTCFNEHCVHNNTRVDMVRRWPVEGLAAGRTVNGWLFTAEDKTLGLLAPDLAWHGHFFLNDSSREVITNPGQVNEYTAFTGKGDAQTVPTLYQSYMERIAKVLTSTLALQSALDSQVERSTQVDQAS